jgi:hypothetical protein
MRKVGRSILAVSMVAGALALAGCSTTPSITGVWSASDGSATKVINEDGSCSGMYYNGTEPLDIGGPMTCALSSSDASGYFSLIVRQPPNQATYEVQFADNTMTLSSGGTEIVTLTKQ